MQENCSNTQLAKEYAKGCAVGASIGFFTDGGPKGAVKGCVVGGTAKALEYTADCKERNDPGIPCVIL